MNHQITIIFIILLFIFPEIIKKMYDNVFGKILLYVILLLLFVQNNIEGLLLTGVFLYTMHMNNTPSTYKEPLPLVKTETTFVDLEKNIQSVDSKNIISN